MPKTSPKTVVCHDVFWNLQRVPVKKLTYRPSVYGVLIEKNKVLLSRQWDGYDFPGGGGHKHETVGQTLKREFWEETGLKVNVGLPVWCSSSFFTFRNHKKSVHAICIYFLCKRVSGAITDKNLVGEELGYVQKPEWIDVRRISRIKFYNSLKKDSATIIKRALSLKK
ncbi:MAG: NUDIX hydrolase [Patescibacteria group bacterium]|jgi:8-oxo-dGTP pyrophosphatase MutT (NUDIX family)